MRIRSALLALLCAGTLLAAPAHAVDRDEAAAIARQTTGGRVLAVEAGRRNGDAVFVVRVLTPSGEVRVVVVDARSGAVR
ncbi:PepSY domain-containing protein [Pseudothauera lacus]|uniref:Peptidase n=1 Tax=Pseudothauera lacus TaxID=2136175 RepID=A0A2T4IDN9_9RHOO|nr:PepSY domain-containing protein [Pseudothauera lacus]PTD95880.1 peptidase [Pseudothauera lacus]